MMVKRMAESRFCPRVLIVAALLWLRVCAATAQASDPAAASGQGPNHNGISHCQAIGAGDPAMTPLSVVCEFALTYRRELPDFICEQTTTSTGLHSTTVMKAQVTFEKGHEHYSNATIDGKPAEANSAAAASAMKVISWGELGSDLVELFEPPVVAEFKFQKEEKLHTIHAWLYEFHIPAEKNTFWALRDSRGIDLHPECQGKLWVERPSGQLLRLELRPVRLPKDFEIIAAHTTTDYSEIAIADAGTFLLPSKSVTTACLHHPGRSTPTCRTNVLVFHDCRKFVAKTRVITDHPQP